MTLEAQSSELNEMLGSVQGQQNAGTNGHKAFEAQIFNLQKKISLLVTRTEGLPSTRYDIEATDGLRQ